MLGYGVSLAILFEFFRRRKEKFHEPSNNWVFDYLRDQLFPINEATLSAEGRWERMLRRHIRRDNDVLGNDSDLRAYGISSLASFYRDQHRLPEARAWQDLALRLLHHSLPPDHPRVLEALRKMAELHTELYDYAAAEECWRRIIATCATPDHDDLRSLIKVLAERPCWAEAMQFAAQLRRSIQKAHGPYSNQLEDWLAEELKLATRAGDDTAVAAIKEHYEQVRAINIGIMALGSDNPYLARDIDKLSSMLRKRGETECADWLRERASMLRLIGKVRGTDYPGIERDLERVAAWYRERGECADGTIAFHLEKRAERIRNKRNKKF